MPENRYFEWLCSQVCDDDSYAELLWHLFKSEFKYLNPMDENRAQDGIALRYLYLDETNDSNEILDGGCNILELLIGVAKRVESFMCSYEYCDRTNKWFWGMIKNLGLEQYTNNYYDPREVDDILHRFMAHGYQSNGNGGLFTIDNGIVDMRDADIWYQVCAYVNEILPKRW